MDRLIASLYRREFGNDFATGLALPLDDVRGRNINYWDNFLNRTVPETVNAYGIDTDHAFEQHSGYFLQESRNMLNPCQEMFRLSPRIIK